MKTVRKCFAVASILVGGVAVGIPETITVEGISVSKMMMGIATALNAVSLYLLKEEPEYSEPVA